MSPKLKLLVLILISSGMLIFTNFILIIIITISAFIILFTRGIQGKFTSWVKPLFLVFLLVVLLQSFTFSGFGFSLEGFYSGVLYAMRLLMLTTLVFLFVQTTRVGGLAEAFDFMPTSISQVLVLALSLLPNMTELIKQIVNAQKSRGLNFRSPNIFRTYFPILIPLFAKTLYRSEHMALAMQARGFEGGEPTPESPTTPIP